MKKNTYLLAIPFTILAMIGTASAISDPIVFPRDGQSNEQQRNDETSCSSWAKGNTGVDPSYIRAKLEMTDQSIISQSHSNQPKSVGRRVFGAAAMGAALGGVDKGIDNKVGKRAVQVGMLGASRAVQDKRQYQQQQQMSQKLSQKQQLENQYNAYTRAFSVCMDAKGYSVR